MANKIQGHSRIFLDLSSLLRQSLISRAVPFVGTIFLDLASLLRQLDYSPPFSMSDSQLSLS